MRLSSLLLCGMICTCGERKENVVLTPDTLRGKNPVGEKVLSTEALIAYVQVLFKL